MPCGGRPGTGESHGCVLLLGCCVVGVPGVYCHRVVVWVFFSAVVFGCSLRVNVCFVVGRLFSGWLFVWCLVCEVCCYGFCVFLLLLKLS